jgi:Ca2+-binding RTX toxin-like protein
MEAGATLNGDAGSNTLLGTLNRDSLFGKAGNDTLTGGSGADRFVFDTALNGATNVDTITDFTPGSDKLVLSEVIFTSLTAGNLNPANLVSGASPVAQDADDFILYSTSTGQLSYDADASGAGTAIVFAVLSNRALLTANEVEIGAV